MRQARECIHARGGVAAANVFTKITLALFDQYDWYGLPSMPPEIMLLPKRFYFSIYEVSYWTRAVLIPLLVVFAHRPVCRIPEEEGIAELFVTPRELMDYGEVPPFKKDAAWFTWRNFFITLDRLLKLYERMPYQAFRETAVQKAIVWTLDHMRGNGGLGAIYPAMANSAVALHCLGYSADHPLLAKALKEIEDLERSEERRVGKECRL